LAVHHHALGVTFHDGEEDVVDGLEAHLRKGRLGRSRLRSMECGVNGNRVEGREQRDIMVNFTGEGWRNATQIRRSVDLGGRGE
jgi:hypothetical protein